MKNIPTFESFINEKISMEAVQIHTILGTGQDAAQNFIDDNNIDADKLVAYVIRHKNSVEKYAIRDMINGISSNPKLLKKFK